MVKTELSKKRKNIQKDHKRASSASKVLMASKVVHKEHNDHH